MRKGKFRPEAILLDTMRPTNKARHVGIEIEFTCNEGEEVLLGALFASPFGAYVSLGEDGSVSSNVRLWAHELRILCLEEEVPRVVRGVCRILHKFDALVNSTCGLHVHLDMRSRKVEDAFYRLVNSESVLYSLVRASRRTNEFCKPLQQYRQYDGLEFDERKWQPLGSRPRHRGINAAAYSKHKTLEVRMHHGSLDPEEIINWVNVLIGIVDAPQLVEVNNVEALSKILKLPPKQVQYLKRRSRKYARRVQKLNAA